jgi:two-component system LytT family response regulator
MKVVIIEDEFHAAQRLKKLLANILSDLEILDTIDSVEDAVVWFKSNAAPDLVFMDIQLADGISFSIFKQVKVETPIIFTTAFDQYSLKAFKVNSVDYLLKPIDESELNQAIQKFDKLNQKESKVAAESLAKLMSQIDSEKVYRERFLLKNKDKYTFLLAEEIAYFYSEDSLSFIVTQKGKSYIHDTSLNHLAEDLNPAKFFRINRKQIVNIKSIDAIHNHFNNRIKLDLNPTAKGDVIVSRDKVKDFKLWLGA